MKPKTPEESMVELATPECSRLEDCLYYVLTQENFKRGDFHSKKNILTIKHLLVLSKNYDMIVQLRKNMACPCSIMAGSKPYMHNA